MDNHLEKLLEGIFLSKYLSLTMRKNIESKMRSVRACSRDPDERRVVTGHCWVLPPSGNDLHMKVFANTKGKQLIYE